jgi:hypothetical protein
MDAKPIPQSQATRQPLPAEPGKLQHYDDAYE